MQIHRLRLVNFRQHEDTELVLGAGLTGIVGPNGAGKSTLLEAIAFAMYGTPAARGTRDSIRRRGAPPRSPVRVELDFALGPHEFRVVRGLSQAELFQDGDPAPIANSLGAVTDKLSRLLGMTRDEFFNTYFTGQKEIAVMARMSGPERAQFLSRVLGYERLRVAQDRLKESRSELRVRLQTLQAGLPDLGELGAEEARALALVEAAGVRESQESAALREAEARLLAVTPRWTALQGLRSVVQSLEADIRLAEHQVTHAQERNKVLDREITEALQAQAHLAAIAGELVPLAALRTEREALERLFAASTHRATLHAQLTEVRSSLAELDQRLAALPTAAQVGSARAEAEAKRKAAAALASQAEERRIVWVRDLQDAETKRQALRDQYRDLQEQLERITAAGQDGACPTCSRPLGADFEAVLGVLGRQVEEVRFNGNFYKQRIEQLEREPTDLQGLDRDVAAAEAAATAAAAEVSRLEAPLRDAGKLAARRASLSERITELEATLAGAEGTYDPARHEEVKRLLGVLEPKALEAERYRAQADRAARLAPELLSAEKAVSEREDALGALRRRREEVAFSEEEIETVRQELEASEAARRSAEIRVVETRGERAAAEEAGRAVARRKAERDARAGEVRAVERRLLLAQELDRALTDLRTDLNAALRPDLSDLASGFLRELTKGRYTDLELDEDYTPALLEDGEVKPVISGGEEDVANLALRLAISQMIAERAGQPLSLLILDEVFGSLDEERRGAVMDLLRGLADRFPQVILITHIEAVREGFDRLIRIERDPARRISVLREDPLGGEGTMWRRERKLVGPERPTLLDIDSLNRVFSESFTDRYRRDGMPGVRVPHLNPKVWRFALEGAGQGGMVWHEGGEIVAFNIAHCSGDEGWMGPLAVRPDCQGEGLGKQVVLAGVQWLKSRAARTIGLETMPRTVENVGFYSRLGFRPGHLTVTLSRSPQPSALSGCMRLSTLDADAAAECAALTTRLAAGRSFAEEIRLTAQLELGDTTLFRRGGELVAFAVWHSTPLAEGRPREDVRVLKLVATDPDAMESVLQGVGDAAVELGVDRVAVRFQTAFEEGYGRLVDSGWQAHWTDLRMTLAGYPERPTTGIVLSNWEI